MTRLVVTDLGKSFGAVAAVDGVSFELAGGQVLALIGPNGAGKTTCFNCLTGQLTPDRGEARLDDRRLTGLSPRRIWRHGVARTFQIAAAFASLTVLSALQLAGAARAGRGFQFWRPLGTRYRDPALALLERLGIAGLADHLCSALSYGDLRRVELALALTAGPRLLLMDEPTAGMAPAERQALMALTVGLVRENGLAVLFVEHDMDTVFGCADRVLVMDRGRLIADGPPDAVRADPRVRSVYLGRDGSEGRR